MIVWGGFDGTSWLSGGARFDPVYQGWTPVSDVGAPSARFHHTAIWTGSRMLVWGGETNVRLGDGGLYDPAADAWSQVSSAGAPSARSGHTALWTGTRMLVWGGIDGHRS